jgi:hypothetical protein
LEAVEATLVVKLHEILRPVNVALMSADDIARIAGQSEGSLRSRKELNAQIQVLNEGIKTCARIVSIALDGNRGVKREPSSHPYSILVRCVPAEGEKRLVTRSSLRNEIPILPRAATATPSTDTASSGEELVLVEPYTFEMQANLSQEDMPIVSCKSRKKRGKKLKRTTGLDEE